MTMDFRDFGIGIFGTRDLIAIGAGLRAAGLGAGVRVAGGRRAALCGAGGRLDAADDVGVPIEFAGS